MKNKTSLLPFIILGLVIVLGCSRLGGKTDNGGLLSNSKTDSNEFTLADREWKSYDLDPMDIRVELPGAPADKTPPESMMPAGTKDIFSSIRINSYDDKDFQSSFSQLVPTGKRPFTIKELADTSMAALKKQARDLNYTVDVKSPTNAKLNGTFTRNGNPFEVHGCCIFKKDNPARIWAVITVYPKDSTDGKTASEKIIQSATFKGASEECE
jgi:hypothetical protein